MSSQYGSGNETGNWSRDIDLSQTSQSQRKDNKASYHTTVIEFISEIERISEIEAKSESKLEKGLFTTKEVLNGFMNGFKVGILTNIFIFLHILVFALLSFSFVTNFLKFEPAPFFLLKYLFAVLIIVTTIFIASLSRLAVGAYTNKAIITFFSGKFISSFASGILILFLLSFLEAVILDNFNSILHFLSSYTQNSLEIVDSDLKYFISSFPALYFETIVLVLISSFLPFMFFGLRKYFFSTNRISDYENY